LKTDISPDVSVGTEAVLVDVFELLVVVVEEVEVNVV
jgi:hypothetical protein